MDGGKGREGGRERGREKHEGRGTRDEVGGRKEGKEGKDGRLPLKGWRCDCAREKLDQVRTSAVLNGLFLGLLAEFEW